MLYFHHTLLNFGNSQKSVGAKSGEYGRWSFAKMPFPVKAESKE
jgi:hypothetical protein